jgi:hypothetical protein
VLSRSENAETSDSAPSAGDVAPNHPAGPYLTDEVFLYRVVGFVEGESGGMVELEDCYHLDVVRIPVAAVAARGLRAVMPWRVSPDDDIREA